MKDYGRYINPFTDFGFKKLFGSEPNKDLLIDFLNQVLPPQHKVVELQYGKNEYQGNSEIDRKVVIDVYCTGKGGTKFIIEVQRSWQQFFKDRTVFYASRLIQDQAKRGSKWSYELSPVYCISILDYKLEKPEKPAKMKYTVQLMDIENKKIFYDKLTFIYLEVPKFVKKEEELETDFDKWMFVLKNITRLEKLPELLKTKIMTKFFEVAEINKMPEQERAAYEESLKIYRDNENAQRGAELLGFRKAEEMYSKILEEERSEKEAERSQKELAIKQKESAIIQKESAIRLLFSHDVSIGEIANQLGIPEEEVMLVLKKS